MNNDVQINPFFRPESSFVTTCMSISRNYFASTDIIFLAQKSLKPIRLQYIRSAQYVIGSPLCGNCDNFLSQKFRENDAFSTKLNRTNVLMYECKLFSWNCFLVRVTFQNFHTANSCLFYSNKKNGTWVHSIEILPCKSANFMWNQFGWIKTLNTAT